MVEGVNDEQLGRLGAYEALLRSRAIPLGLVSATDEHRLMERHIADSLRGAACLEPNARRVLDLGSGAGLPGIPIAVVEPDRAVVLVERKARAVAFLELVVEELGLANVRVIPGPIESLEAEEADVCLARALAPLKRAWGMAASILAPTGYLVYWAGSRWSEPRPDELPSVGWQICARPWFSWQGPVVIMKRLLSPPAEERNDEH
jgi:16S rRNA (guanine527-N7)-methyltransferase